MITTNLTVYPGPIRPRFTIFSRRLIFFMYLVGIWEYNNSPIPILTLTYRVFKIKKKKLNLCLPIL